MLLLWLFSQIQNHFEIFEHIQGFDIIIFTSTNTQDETVILWSGFFVKRGLIICQIKLYEITHIYYLWLDMN
jgi:hypothetical protein